MARARKPQSTFLEHEAAVEGEDGADLSEAELKAVAGGVAVSPPVKPLQTRSGIAMEFEDSSTGGTSSDSASAIKTRSGIVMEFDG